MADTENLESVLDGLTAFLFAGDKDYERLSVTREARSHIRETFDHYGSSNKNTVVPRNKWSNL